MNEVMGVSVVEHQLTPQDGVELESRVVDVAICEEEDIVYYPTCRVCWDVREEDVLVTPCACKGTTWQEERWMSEEGGDGGMTKDMMRERNGM